MFVANQDPERRTVVASDTKSGLTVLEQHGADTASPALGPDEERIHLAGVGVLVTCRADADKPDHIAIGSFGDEDQLTGRWR